MKIVVSTKELKVAVMKAIQAVPTGKPQVPVLSGVLIKTSGDCVEITGTDFTTAIKARISAEIEEAGECVVAAKTLAAIATKLTGSVTTIEVDESLAVIKSDATRFELFTMKVEDFPAFAFADSECNFIISPAHLKAIINHTVFAASDDDSRPIFTGVNFLADSHFLTALATNTHRLAKYRLDLEDDLPYFNFIVHSKTLEALKRLLVDNDLVRVSVNNKAVKFATGNAELFSRLIDGTFPSTEKIFNIDGHCSAFIKKTDFLEGLERVSLIARNSEYHTCVLKFDKEGLELCAEAYATGKAVEHLNAEVTGELEIAFNIDYLIDYLKTCDGDIVNFQGGADALTPAKFVGSDSDVYQYVITPVRR